LASKSVNTLNFKPIFDPIRKELLGDPRLRWNVR